MNMDRRASLKSALKNIAIFKIAVVSFKSLRNKHGLLKKLRLLSGYFADYRRFLKLPANARFAVRTSDLYPRIYDKTSHTPIDPVYFYQDAWCAGKVFATKPDRHYDVGSKAETIGIIAQFTPTTMVDIRPLDVQIDGLSFVEGSILALPFADRSVSSLSSICVIEHIGLGRYGDPLDAFGSEKSAAELARVLAAGGNLFISVPIDRESTVYFNAHRSFTPSHVRELFPELQLVEERYIYGNTLGDAYAPEKGFGTGLYHFRRP